MLYGEYQFPATYADAAHLPPFKGATFRGVFGVALKNVVCGQKRQECAACLLPKQCVSALVFETLTPKGQGRPSPPHPFVIEPPLSPVTHFQPGDRIACLLILFGWANGYLPYFICAFLEMGQLGLGKRQDQAMLMGGMAGSITYTGDLAEFLPILKYAEKVRLGKATTFSLGKIRVEHD